jgi:antitoxin VapB
MALSIKDPEADKLARELTRRTGESITEAVIVALRERLARTQKSATAERRLRAMREVAATLSALPVLDGRSADALIDYDDDGLPR